MTRYAILVGCSKKSDYKQKSLFNIYSLLKSTDFGCFNDKEILVMSEGVDFFVLNMALKNLFESGLDFLFLYFCGNSADKFEKSFFTIDESKVEIKKLEKIAKKQILIFDSCESLISFDDFYDSDFNFNKEEILSSQENFQKSVENTLKSDFLIFSQKEKPFENENGLGVLTESFVNGVKSCNQNLDFKMLEKNCEFEMNVFEAGK